MKLKWLAVWMIACFVLGYGNEVHGAVLSGNPMGPANAAAAGEALQKEPSEQKGPGVKAAAQMESEKGRPDERAAGGSAGGGKPEEIGQALEETGNSDLAEEETGTWRSENGGWRYYDEAGGFDKNKWAKIKGYWYYFDWDGYMVTGWLRIAGNHYCFRDSGELTIGWCYNDDSEKWYYFDRDGFPKKGWFQDKDGSWYWFSSWGEMVSSGYKSIDGKRYYFLDNGQMAANQYAGLFYMDENGQRDKRYDITLEGKDTNSSVPSDTRNSITEALQNVPREWMKYFVENGWKILYYPDKNYFSAPESDGGLYYVYHKLDTSYRKLKFCDPQALTEAFGEYIGYAADCYEKDGQLAMNMAVNQGNIDDFVDVPSYYLNDMQFYFGKLVEVYVSNKDTKRAMEENSPGICDLLRKVLYLWQPEDSPNRLPVGKSTD